MDGTLQERGPCWLGGLFEGHGAHSAGACRALCVEAEFRHRGQPGHRARTCPLKAHTQAHTHTHSHACTCTHIYKHKRACKYTQTRTHTYTCAHTQTHMHTRAHIHTHKHTGTYARTHTHTHSHTHTHTHTHMHMHAHVARMMGFANISASLATHPHLPYILLT